jgi:hypothetical protein
MRRVALVALVVVLAGCSLPFGAGAGTGLDGGAIGVQNGYQYDDELSIDAGDGLNASERSAVTSRAAARVEKLRGLAFEEPVPVRVISRTEYRQNRSGPTNGTHARWNNQVWEALFVVGEDRNVSAVLDRTLESSVLGYYSPSSGEIVVVSDSETPQLRRSTLVHELVHALQDQQFGLNSSADTQDRQLARKSVVEGEAVHVTDLYAKRCDGEWTCVTAGDGGSGGVPDPGVFLVLIQPYTSGPTFVETIRSRGGWDAVDDLYSEPPVSTEQVVHPDRYPGDRPRNVTVPDRASGGWERFDHDPVADTVGEVSIFATFAHNDVDVASVSLYSYVHPASAGWAGDSLVPYRNDGQDGYVWETAWDSPAEAEEFHQTYLSLLAENGAVDKGDGVYVIPEGPFADAFRVTREGDRVRVVNGPDVAALDGIHSR